ncbi:MAG: phosphotransferase family protein [Burkholderiaceae bacterium]|nr:phosphotransferase family protein [Burkholderiaceae bacterium]
MIDIEALAGIVRGFAPSCRGIENLRRLTGGASQETWSFDAVPGGGPPLGVILRRMPGGAEGSSVTESRKISLTDEAGLLGLAAGAGVPVPAVLAVLPPAGPIGAGYLMTRIEGETIPRRFLREPRYAAARAGLARQCGEILARLHAIPRAELPPLRLAPAAVELELYVERHRSYGWPKPVLELAIRWLRERAPAGDIAPVLVHGDFRSGNLMIDERGVAAVLDWELAHLGDPMEDLGWICVNSWRFGEDSHPVGGFGSREDLFAGYEAAGGMPVDPERVRYWQVLGTLKWGVMCASMLEVFRSGEDRSVERVAIARRASEAAIDLLRLMAGRD